MYCWNLLSGDLSAGPYLLGVTDDLAKAMRICEPPIESGCAFMAYIEAVRPAISARGLQSCYIRTGRTWLARRTIRDRVHWEERESCTQMAIPPVAILRQ